jgi:glucosamine-6-phosphate deaminase
VARQTARMARPSVLVLDDHRHVGLTAAELVANRIRARTHMRLLLPTGHTPLELYRALRDHAADGSLPTDHVTVLGLDEYLGLGRDDPRSFREALDGAAVDPEAEAARYQAVLDTAPVDLAVLGLGRDAHVAFNEPGSRPADGVRRVMLDPSTLAAAAGDFGGVESVPREALTVGLRTLLGAREILLIVTGEEKAESLRAALEGPIGPEVPASRLRHHPSLTVLCDRPAAARLRPAVSRASDHVAIVLGHREPGISAEHRISAHSRARLARAVRLCQEMPVRAVVLTGYTHTAGLSEAEQMAREWPLDDVPVLLEVAGRNTAENASRSLPIVLALGVASSVSVVTSLWHLRAPYFFAPYRAFGFELSLCPARPLGGWAHLLAEELGGLAGMPRQRRAAMDAVRLPEGP